MLFHPQASEIARTRYTLYYSMSRLRRLAEQRLGTRHSDLFSGLRLVMEKLGGDGGYPELGLPALNSLLFSHEAIPDLADGEIANRDLLDAIRALAFTSDGHTRRVVDYRNLGPEELGSVYESLLELHPILHIDTATFKLDTASGHERKTTGSYYTPTSLIICLLDSALDPVLDEACVKSDPEKAILNLKICDPACGSGHFLIAAAHRIARRLAAVRTGEEEPTPNARRRALRDVIGRCIYGVDINPMSVELCKVNLWMEAIEPGKPLSFLEQHIQCGDSLLGATPALLANGIPDSAFEPIEGDDKKLCSEYRKRNRQQREGNRSLFDPEGKLWDRLGDLTRSMMQLEEMSDDTAEEIRLKQEYYGKLVESGTYKFGKLWANAWCATFVWKKTREFPYSITEEVFRNIEQNPYNTAAWMEDEIDRLANQYKFFHWHLAFPDVFRVPMKDEQPENEQASWSGGFDLVVGNPPWERIKIQEKEWFISRRPDIANAVNAAQRRRMISALMHEDPSLYLTFLDDLRKAEGESHLIRHSERYSLCGRGDINTYAIFAETMRLILGPDGRIGCIVPSGIATDDTTKFFFRDLVESRSLVSLFAFENEAMLFPGVLHSMKFALLTVAGRSAFISNAKFAFGLRYTEDLNSKERLFSLSAEDIALFNPNTHTSPVFRYKRDVDLMKSIYTRIPVLIKEGTPDENLWGIKFSMMFHMGNDSNLFRLREQLISDGWTLKGNIFYKDEKRYLPLYESKMIWQYNHRFGTHEWASTKEPTHNKLPELSTEQLANPDLYPLPNNWVLSTEVERAFSYVPRWFLSCRRIASANVNRTFVGAIIPGIAASDSLSLIFSSHARAREYLCLLSNLCSFIADYILRQNVGGPNLSYFILKQIPFLPPTAYSNPCPWSINYNLVDWISLRALELTYTAWDLEPFANDCGYNGPPFPWKEERRFLLRCELDAAYFHLYEIRRDDVDYIMETFQTIKQRDEKQYGEYRIKRVILEIYDKLKQAIDTGAPYQTMLQPPPADPSLAHPPQIGMKV